jgi:hypothetical protein
MGRIVELNIGDGRRAMRMIELAKQVSCGQEVCYVGIDLFEGRAEADGRGLSLKAAHQLLRGAGGRVRLVPGPPAEALVRVANSLGKIDLLVVPAELDSDAFGRMWHFVPRMLHERSVVFVERRADDGRTTARIKPSEEIDALAALGVGRRAA